MALTSHKRAKVAPLLRQQFPVEFSNGYKIDSLAFWCTKCGKVANPDQMRGYVSKIVDQAVDIAAGFSCGNCKNNSTYKIRIRDDKTISYYTFEKGWNSDNLKLGGLAKAMLYLRWLPKYMNIIASKYKLKYHRYVFARKLNKILNKK